MNELEPILSKTSIPKIGAPVWLTVGGIAGMGLVLTVLHLSWLMTARRTLEAQVYQQQETALQQASQQVLGFEQTTQTVQQWLQQSRDRRFIDWEDREQRNDLLLHLFLTQPTIQGLQLAYPNGKFTGITKVSPERLQLYTRQSQATENPGQETVDTYLKKGDRWELQTQSTLGRPLWGDITQARWFQQALQAPNVLSWTIQHHPHRGLSLDVSLGLHDRDGKLDSVLDLSGDLQQWVQTWQAAATIPDSQWVILDEQQTVIAHSLPDAGVAPFSLAKSDQPIFTAIAHTLQTESLDLSQLKTVQHFWISGSQRYYLSLVPLGSLKGAIALLTPADPMLRPLERQQWVLSLLLAVLILSGPGWVALYRWVWVRPVLQLQQAVQDAGTEEFEAAQLRALAQRSDELGHLATTLHDRFYELETNAQQVAEQMQQLQSQVALQSGNHRRLYTPDQLQQLLLRSQQARMPQLSDDDFNDDFAP